MPQRSVLSPSRLKSPAASSAFEMFSETRLNLYVPASGAVQVPAPVTGNVGPVTEVIMARQDPSLSRSGWVPVTQSTILRSPVVVVCSAGWSRSTPESMTPIVIPRPSHAWLASLKSTDPMSRVGMKGLSFGVLAPGPATAAALVVPDPSASGLGRGIDSLRSTATTDVDFAIASTRPVGTVALMYPYRSLTVAVKPPAAVTAAATDFVEPFV